MRILYIITGLRMGGAERITIDIANFMQEKGHEVAMAYLNGENEHENINKEIILFPLKMKKNPLGLIDALNKASKFIKQWKPDIIHSQMFHANIFSRLLKIKRKTPKIICTEHSKYIGSNIRMFMYRITDFLSDLNTNVSKEALDYFIESKSFDRKKSYVMYNGINLKRFYKDDNIKKDKNYFTFINVGRLTEAKDQENLIEAFYKLFTKYKDIKLIIIGEGEKRECLTEKIKKYQLENNVLMPGIKTNIQYYYNICDCFVLSSAWEGFGIVIAEAMACKLPVIATNAGGCAEVVNDDNFVVPTKNSNALSEKMEQVYLLSDKDRLLLGERNRKIAKRFDIKSIAKQWEVIYKNLTGNNENNN